MMQFNLYIQILTRGNDNVYFTLQKTSTQEILLWRQQQHQFPGPVATWFLETELSSTQSNSRNNQQIAWKYAPEINYAWLQSVGQLGRTDPYKMNERLDGSCIKTKRNMEII